MKWLYYDPVRKMRASITTTKDGYIAKDRFSTRKFDKFEDAERRISEIGYRVKKRY